MCVSTAKGERQKIEIPWNWINAGLSYSTSKIISTNVLLRRTEAAKEEMVLDLSFWIKNLCFTYHCVLKRSVFQQLRQAFFILWLGNMGRADTNNDDMTENFALTLMSHSSESVASAFYPIQYTYMHLHSHRLILFFAVLCVTLKHTEKNRARSETTHLSAFSTPHDDSVWHDAVFC